MTKQKMNNKLIHLLSPYGKWQHSKGLQIVNKESALKMLKKFPSVFMQKFFKKIPIYVGHPDESAKKSALKKQIVGYVEKLVALDDGIVAICSYCDCIYDKILKKDLRSMSPRWKTTQLEDGNFMPIELISIGLTNEPNIENSGKIFSPSNLIYQEKSLSEKSYKEKLLANELERSILNSKSCIKSLEKIEKIQDCLTESISKKLLTSALNEGAISAKECDVWAKDFKESFDETKKKLLKTKAQKEELSVRELISLTKQKMSEKNLSWDSAYSEIKKEKSLNQ